MPPILLPPHPPTTTNTTLHLLCHLCIHTTTTTYSLPSPFYPPPPPRTPRTFNSNIISTPSPSPSPTSAAVQKEAKRQCLGFQECENLNCGHVICEECKWEMKRAVWRCWGCGEWNWVAGGLSGEEGVVGEGTVEVRGKKGKGRKGRKEEEKKGEMCIAGYARGCREIRDGDGKGGSMVRWVEVGGGEVEGWDKWIDS